MQKESYERESNLSGDDDRQIDRHAQRLILVPSSKFVGYGSVDADDEAEGLEAPYINQFKWMVYASLEASRTPEISRYVENDNLADIKLKLTCTNSIAAMNIYMEQMKYHRATEQRAMDCTVKMRRSFFNRIQIVSNPFEARELTTQWMYGWMVTRGVK